MRRDRKTDCRSRADRGKTCFPVSAIVSVSIAGALVLLLLTAILFGPSLRARPVFSDALKAPKTSSDTVRIGDPYVSGALLPDSVEVTLTEEESAWLTDRLLAAFDSYRYVETRGISSSKLLPYVIVRGASTVYFYLDTDSVWVEENSTFYRFRPRTSDGKAAYAELYEFVTERLSGSEP